MDQERLGDHWLRQPAVPAPDLAARSGPAQVGRRRLLDRAEAAARAAGELAVDWFWLRRAVRCERAERLSTAAERQALAAHRAGRLWPPRGLGALARLGRRARQSTPA